MEGIVTLFENSALAIGNTDLTTKLVEGLDKCIPEEKGLCLRTMINSHSLPYRKQVDLVLKGAGDSILKWLQDKSIKLNDEEGLRILAAIIKLKKDTDWFNPEEKGERFFRFEYIR